MGEQIKLTEHELAIIEKLRNDEEYQAKILAEANEKLKADAVEENRKYIERIERENAADLAAMKNYFAELDKAYPGVYEMSITPEENVVEIYYYPRKTWDRTKIGEGIAKLNRSKIIHKKTQDYIYIYSDGKISFSWYYNRNVKTVRKIHELFNQRFLLLQSRIEAEAKKKSDAALMQTYVETTFPGALIQKSNHNGNYDITFKNGIYVKLRGYAATYPTEHFHIVIEDIDKGKFVGGVDAFLLALRDIEGESNEN